MILRCEQQRALVETAKLLQDLLYRDVTPRVPKVIRHRASQCLRHWPYLTSTGKPVFSKDEFPCPKIK